MNLDQTIQELEQKAQQYREAADRLRALQDVEPPAGSGGASTVAAGSAASAKRGGASSGNASKRGAKKAVGTKTGQTGSKRTMSPETRAKIAAAVKARFAAKKSQAAG